MATEKKEFPEEEELVLCTVTQISKTSAFVTLDDYNKTGILITAEVAPGRIRNIRDYISPNKKIVCKVLRVDREKNHIDLSLRRVSLKERKEVMEKYKKDKDALSILKRVIGESNLDSVISKIKEEFGSLFNFMSLARENKQLLNKLGLEKESEKLNELIQERIKSKKVVLKSGFILSGKEGQSITLIKKALTIQKPGVKITYLSAPNYLLTVESKEYREARNTLKEVIAEITNNLGKIGCYARFEDA